MLRKPSPIAKWIRGSTIAALVGAVCGLYHLSASPVAVKMPACVSRSQDAKNDNIQPAAPRTADDPPALPELPSLPELPQISEPAKTPAQSHGVAGAEALRSPGVPVSLPAVRGFEDSAPATQMVANPETSPEPGPISGLFTPIFAPNGFTGRSSVVPRDVSTDPHFIPMEDRWRTGFPEYDRYGKGHPIADDYLYKQGHWWDPYNQNVLKGDYAIIGQNVFLEITATTRTVVEPRLVPIATTPFESTARPFEDPFFGRPNQLGFNQFFILSLDLFRGDAAFRPVDWRFKVTPIFNINNLDLEELAVVNPDVRRGTTRWRTFMSLQEWFFETKLADISPNYDFVSMRIGSQPFVSDFRGFIFADTNRGLRIFGNRNSNREQFNLAYFNQQEKDTNSELNSFNTRGQQVLIGNYYVQDFIWPGYTAQLNFAYNHEDPSFHFDTNSVLVRPDPVGVFTPHGLDVVYLGWTGDGHINRFNIDHAFYWALGRDSLNPLANQGQDISAQMAALEVSYDRDWARFRTSFFWASGDNNPKNSHACGFDAIFDNPQFAGGEFSYWQRQAIRLFGVNLVNRESLLPDLRSSKIQGQSNFVNPGLFLVNAGVDFEVTPKFRIVNNVNFLWFDNVAPLQTLTYQAKIAQAIGTDLSMGVEYRPLLSNNIILKAGVSSLIPAQGFRDLYNNLRSTVNPLFAVFVDVAFTY
ncbi:MAG: hypothetical protein HY040_26040 [Planctomycetes bacterium]|nr:hypothetical protein [Planctomycetota bacterium]